jgi:hypothetical protein
MTDTDAVRKKAANNIADTATKLVERFKDVEKENSAAFIEDSGFASTLRVARDVYATHRKVILEGLTDIFAFGATGAKQLSDDAKTAEKLTARSAQVLAAAAAVVDAFRDACVSIEAAGMRSSVPPALKRTHEGVVKKSVNEARKIEKAAIRFAADADKALRRPATMRGWS